MRTAASSLLVGLFLLVSLVVSVPTSAQTELPPNVQSESPERGRDGRKTWIVYPVNQSPDDANAIQQAIDAAKAGDRIVLGAGVFNFGDFDNIRVAKDLTLEGAWNSRDKVPLTTIRGGLNAFLIGRKTPIPKPEFITVNGRQVMHITQDLYGKFHFPFMYTPYFDQATGKPTGVHYNIYDDWVVVNVDVRQITFDRQYGASMFISGVKGGTIERNRFISGWPNQIGIEGLEPLGGQIAFFNMASRPYLPLSYGLLYDPSLLVGSELVRGQLFVQNNFLDGDFVEFPEGASDNSGHVLAVPYANNPTPPGGDYDNYLLQDVPKDGLAFNFHPAQPPPMYWVRKGYTAGWIPYAPTPGVWARRGLPFGAYSLFSEAELTVRDNEFHNLPNAVFLLENGFLGKPFTANIEHNTIINNYSSGTGYSDEGVAIFEYPIANPFTGNPYVPNPGTNAIVRRNQIDSSLPGRWFASLAIDIEVKGAASVVQNEVHVASGSGIGFWAPTQNGVAKGNQIAGSGDYAFFTLPGSNGNLFLNNDVSQFTPVGGGAVNFGLGNPAVPAARGVLFSNSNTVRNNSKPGPLDIVYDCGQNNVIGQMTVLPCPSKVAGTFSPSTAAQQHAVKSFAYGR